VEELVHAGQCRGRGGGNHTGGNSRRLPERLHPGGDGTPDRDSSSEPSAHSTERARRLLPSAAVPIRTSWLPPTMQQPRRPGRCIDAPNNMGIRLSFLSGSPSMGSRGGVRSSKLTGPREGSGPWLIRCAQSAQGGSRIGYPECCVSWPTGRGLEVVEVTSDTQIEVSRGAASAKSQPNEAQTLSTCSATCGGRRPSYRPTARRRATAAEEWGLRADVWRDPRTVVGGSDAGAHLDMMCGANLFETAVLAHAVREFGVDLARRGPLSH